MKHRIVGRAGLWLAITAVSLVLLAPAARADESGVIVGAGRSREVGALRLPYIVDYLGRHAAVGVSYFNEGRSAIATAPHCSFADICRSSIVGWS